MSAQEQTNQETGFTSVSISKADLAFYNEIRNKFAQKHEIDPKKISTATILKTGMSFYAQRMNYSDEDQES